jgi:hypothetical protein
MKWDLFRNGLMEKIKLGDVKFVWERLKGYLVIVSMFFAWRMNVLMKPFSFWWYPVFVVAAVAVLYLDMKLVVSDENAMGLKKNKEFQELKQMVKEIKDTIQRLEKN